MKKLIVKIYFKWRSRTYKAPNGQKLNYILEKSTQKDAPLIIIFSAFPRTGMKATYNYLRTLKDIRANKLFILDNFGFDKRGAYYLAENGDFKIMEAVENIIDTFKTKLQSEKMIFVGTSKGGFASLYFGMKKGADYIISGAPQYKLGNYLSDIPEKAPVLKSIMGSTDQRQIDILNELLTRQLKDTQGMLPKVYLHFSNKEHTYEEHIEMLVEDLMNEGYPIVLDVCEYKIHQEVSLFFPPFLTKTLAEILLETTKKA
ncbi:Two component regulator three Y domain-containing protein [Listeria grandensis]|uniref:Two component regulator three Y domain-containing protein n=1 Tax=Listeria grandensis TaxID=1494963 RepID=A0A7X1CPM9_9LIST|nr:Two component regulator three Y domain-containing protein [Listeria grandensis]MBC1473824.1 Two component regulator three Y domain-containing protein [Listeria grandensis]MBC1936159.1 Two component regulator three Y domain-containing protein [Listeria grandensis]